MSVVYLSELCQISFFSVRTKRIAGFWDDRGFFFGSWVAKQSLGSSILLSIGEVGRGGGGDGALVRALVSRQCVRF